MKMKPFVYNPPVLPLDIIHIDSSLVVLNKPSGLLTVPGRSPDLSDSLLIESGITHVPTKTLNRAIRSAVICAETFLGLGACLVIDEEQDSRL